MTVHETGSSQGSDTGSLQDLRDVAELASAGKLPRIPLHIMAKDQANEALSLLHDNKVSGHIVLT